MKKRTLPVASLLLLIILGSFTATKELFAFDDEQLQKASLVVKYQDGYAISITKKSASLDKTGLEKYEITLPENKEKLIYKAVDINDYPLIESKYQFSLKDRIIIFGSWHRDNLITKGERYYIKYNELGAGNFIEDIMIFVKGTKELNDILPVWAKKYSVDDETFKWRALEERKILNHEFANTAMLQNMHNIVINKISQQAKQNGFTQAIYPLSDEFKEEAYLIELRPESEKAYLLIANGSSLIANVKFSMALLLGERFKVKSELVPLTFAKSDAGYHTTNLYKLEHIYHSDKLGRDLIIAMHNRGFGYTVSLIYQGKNKLEKLPIFTQQGD